MNDAEFKARRSHLASQNVMTANNPPADDVAGLTDYYVEQLTTEFMEGLYDSPDRIQEFIMEGDYDDSNLMLIFQCMSDILQLPNMLTVHAMQEALRAYLDTQTTKKAEEHVENI